MLNQIRLKFNVNRKRNDVQLHDGKHENKFEHEHQNLFIIERISMFKLNSISKNSGKLFFFPIPSLSTVFSVIESKKLMSMFKQMHFSIDHLHHYSFHNLLEKILQHKLNKAM